MTVPARIVSLVPSLTELVFWLGAGDRLVGRTRFCEEPASLVSGVPIVGGTKNPRLERIVELAPDLVLANREENRREDVDALLAAGLNVLLTDPNSVAEAADMVEEIGAALGAVAPGRDLATRTRDAAASEADGPSVRVFVPIWWNPLMGLGSATYGDDLLRCAGAVNVLAGRPRYPQLSLHDLEALAPDLILLPDEPFPFKADHVPTFDSIAPARLVDGKLLWWYGPRMPSAIRTLRHLLREVSPAR